MIKCLFKLPTTVLQSHLAAPMIFFFFNRKSRQKLRIKSVCKGTEKGEDRERNLTWQVNGCCQVRELYTVISVYYFIFLLVLENSEAIRKKTIGRVTITECKQVTEVV